MKKICGQLDPHLNVAVSESAADVNESIGLL